MENYSEAEGENFHQLVRNPLWLELILDRVFSFLPKSALANCRLVCRQWLEVSEPHFVSRNHQSHAKVVIKDADSLFSFLSTFIQRRGFDSDSDSMACPWVSYQLTLLEITPLQLRIDKSVAFERQLHNNQISPIQPELDFDRISPFQQQLFLNICGDSIRRVSIVNGRGLEIVYALSMFLHGTPQLESLELECNISVLDPEKQESKNIFERLENLKNSQRPFFTHLHRLCLCSVDIRDVALEDMEPIFFGIFHLMPHLQDFRILKFVLDSKVRPDRIIASIIQALKLQVKVKVKVQEKGQVPQNSPTMLGQLVSLQLPHLSNQHLQDLHQFSLNNSFRLEKFWLISFWAGLDRQILLTFLQGQAETLQKLCLASYAGILLLHFPLNFTLDNVTTLKIFRWTQNLDEVHLFIPHILVTVPNLKTLVIVRQHDGCSTDIMTTQLMQRLALPQKNMRMASMSWNLVTFDRLTTIKFTGSIKYKDDEEFLLCLTKFCPSVTDLELDFRHHQDTLAIHPVFEVWHRLNRLVLYFWGTNDPLLTESYFTGIPHQKKQPSHQRFCISVMKNFQGRDWYIVHEYDKSRDEETEKKFPSLRILQDLRTLEIYMTGKPEGLGVYSVSCRWFLSDLAVLTTFIRMPQLREFCITHSSISPPVLRTLNDALDLEKCLVGDKMGQPIQFKVEVKDLTCDKGKGQYYSLSLLCGPKSCCTIV